jgi:hypothetical protein
MSEESQIQPPESFLKIYSTPPMSRLTHRRSEIIERYEQCEDLAQALIEPSQEVFWSMNLTEELVLNRTLHGLLDPESALPMQPAEAQWVVRRLCELLGWPEEACPQVSS